VHLDPRIGELVRLAGTQLDVLAHLLVDPLADDRWSALDEPWVFDVDDRTVDKCHERSLLRPPD
jgi:hypothetical protein